MIIQHQRTKEIIEQVKPATLDGVDGYRDTQISGGSARFYAATAWKAMTPQEWVILRVPRSEWDQLKIGPYGRMMINGQTTMYEVQP